MIKLSDTEPIIESSPTRELAAKAIEDYYRRKEPTMPPRWKIEIHDRENPAPPLDVDKILSDSLPNMVGKK